MRAGLAGPLFAFLLVLTAHSRAAAQPPGMPPEPNDRLAVRDTSRLLPRWAYPVYSLGPGWIQTPVKVRQRFEAGFGGTVGLEVRPASRVGVRLSGEYQMLPANAQGTIVETVPSELDGSAVIDTVAFEYGGTGWLLGARTELAVNPVGRAWLQAGAGLGYFSAGISNERSISGSFLVDIRAPGTNGWGWLWSTALRYDFDPAPSAPLSVEVRWQAVDREQDRMQMWRVAVGYRGR